MAKNEITISTTNPYGTIIAKDIERTMNSLKSIDYTDTYPYYRYNLGVTKPEPEDKGTEEWVWVTGYKGTDKDMKCRDYQYEMNKQHDMPEGSKIDICHSGFHFCDKIENVFAYYDVARGNRFFEVKALVRRWDKNGYYTIEHRNDKMAAKSIQFVRELTTDEIFEHLNDERTVDWTYEQKLAARQSSIREYYDILRVNELVQLGYSEAFATWAVRKGGYDVAKMMGTMPNVSMDVKVMTVCMDIYD
jgi:hypothetical protein